MAEFPPGFDDPQALSPDELGVTYRAVWSKGGCQVAVRVLASALTAETGRRRFRNSCLAATVLNEHAGVLPLHEVSFTPEQRPYLVTDLPSDSLAHHLDRHGPAPAAAAARTGAALARALADAHAAGVLHLDVRPENVVSSGKYSPLLAYFGVSRAAAAAAPAELPVTCMMHAAAELFGWETPGPAADVYGLASTLYAMLAGQAPYAAEAQRGRASLYQRVLRGNPPPITRTDIPPGLSGLITAMLDPDPASRPTLAEIVDGFSQHAPVQETPAPAWNAPDLAAAPRRAAVPTTADSSPARTSPAPPPACRQPPSEAMDPTVPVPSTVSAPPAAPISPPPAPPPSVAAAPSPQPQIPDPQARVSPTAGTASHPEAGARGGQHTGLVLLICAGVVALLAGLAWGIVTAGPYRPGPLPPPARQTAPASPMPQAGESQYRVQGVHVSVLAHAFLVSWARPLHTNGVTGFVVIAEFAGRLAQERTVPLTDSSTVFAGLGGGHAYCFVVGTLIEAANGAPAMAAAPPACPAASSG